MTQDHGRVKPVVALFWLTAARAGFAYYDSWRSWADKLIMSMSSPPFWILDMSLAMTLTELEAALGDVLDTLEGQAPGLVDGVLIGYIWWKFERRTISLQECLSLVGEAADAGSSRISCEAIFALLNSLEADPQNEGDVALRARELLYPLRLLAEEQWTEILSYV